MTAAIAVPLSPPSAFSIDWEGAIEALEDFVAPMGFWEAVSYFEVGTMIGMCLALLGV